MRILSIILVVVTACALSGAELTDDDMGDLDPALDDASALLAVFPGSGSVISLRAGTTLDLIFKSGPSVAGKILLSTGGTSGEAALVEVRPDVSIGAALGDGSLAEKVRIAKADQDGRFRVVLGRPGKYHLRARWGNATADRRFELTDQASTVDLGDIQLQSGSSLRGTLNRCPGGEVALIPVPDLSRPFHTGVGEIRHSRAGVDGHFFVSGLLTGQWSVTARCAKVWVEITPAVITVPSTGDLVSVFEVVAAPQ